MDWQDKPEAAVLVDWQDMQLDKVVVELAAQQLSLQTAVEEVVELKCDMKEQCITLN